MSIGVSLLQERLTILFIRMAKSPRSRSLSRSTDTSLPDSIQPRIAAFLQSDLADRIRRSAHVEREYRFSILRPISDYAEDLSDDELLLQGVVDCFFEEQDGLIVLDFKTDRITRAETAQRAEHYRTQLEAYALALEKIMGKPVREKILYFFAADAAVKL